MRTRELALQVLLLALVANERHGNDVEEWRDAVVLRELEHLRVKVCFVEWRRNRQDGGILDAQQRHDNLGEHCAVQTRRLL